MFYVEVNTDPDGDTRESGAKEQKELQEQLVHSLDSVRQSLEEERARIEAMPHGPPDHDRRKEKALSVLERIEEALEKASHGECTEEELVQLIEDTIAKLRAAGLYNAADELEKMLGRLQRFYAALKQEVARRLRTVLFSQLSTREGVKDAHMLKLIEVPFLIVDPGILIPPLQRQCVMPSSLTIQTVFTLPWQR